MEKPLYIQALKQSWRLVWQHKILWIFGLFASFLGQAGMGDLFYKFLILGFKNPNYLDTFFVPKGLVELIILTVGIPLTTDKWFAFIWLFLIIIGFLFFFILISVVSQGAIIQAISQSLGGKKEINFDFAWHKSVKHAGRVFFINVLRKGLILVVTSFVALSLLIVFKTINIFTLTSFAAALILSLVAGIVISFLAVYAICYIVVEEHSFLESIHSAWKLFTNHPLVSLEVGLIVLLLNFVVMLLGFLIIVFLFFLPIAVFWFLSLFTDFFALRLAGIIFGSVLSIAGIMFVGSIFTTFSLSLWTHLFMKMHKEGVKSRLVHFVEKIKY